MTRKQKKKFIKKFKESFKRGLAGTLAFYMFLTSVFVFGPATFNQSYALTGGPSQPEVQSFEPIGTSDMVDLFSGDFTYNIPLLDVEGYPINLAYHSGVTMDQEASWVGLGWNVNVGTINRGLRGIPDDFNGDEIITETNIKPNRTTTIGGGFSGELFGFEALGFSADLGVSFNNYTGVGLSFGGGLNVSMFGGAATAGLGINSSSDNGLSISPSLSLSATLDQTGNRTEKLGISIGSSFNSRGGLKNLSVNASLSKSHQWEKEQKSTKSRKNGSYKSSSGVSGGTGSSFSLGQQTYTPGGGINMNSFAIAGRFKIGLEAFGFDGGVSIDASYASQWLTNDSKHNVSPGYGYFHTQKGQNNEKAILDFNREKDGTVSNSTPALPLTNYTYDVFSVSGQGVGGSYRPFRSEIGFVKDPKGGSLSTSTDLSAEVSPGNLFHAGANVGVVVNTSSSKAWKTNNDAYTQLQYSQNNPYPDYESYYLREANEMSVNSDPTYFDNVGGDKAARFKLKKSVLFNTGLDNVLEMTDGTEKNFNDNTRDVRDKRNSIINILTIAQVKNGMGLNGANAYPSNAYANSAQDHHIGEITSLGTDGMRYVYGLPAYNTKQQEVTFAVGQKRSGTTYPYPPDCNSGLIQYDAGANSLDNEWGVDNYFQMKETPAYAHSFLLTAVVSPDYVDLDNNGPSPKDLGSYTKFIYSQVENYNWRTPTEHMMASYSAGLNSDPEDDKANYIYGEKELWYLERIETKNFVAIFETENRQDGKGVVGKNGNTLGGASMKYLKSIKLYAKPDYDESIANVGDASEATILKQVHFEYDYSLCQGIDNNPSGGGKLTLKKVYFTYRDSQKGKLSPYSFEYNEIDPISGLPFDYNMKGYDSWGNYKPNEATSCLANSPLGSADYPYVNQSDKAQQDSYASAWCLSSVSLPSGGRIDIDLESDDYAFVQNRDAMQMFKIIGVGDDSGGFEEGSGTYNTHIVMDDNNKNRRIFFELDPSNTTNIQPYIENIDFMYFRCLMKFTTASNGFDYVPGYAEIAGADIMHNVPGYGDVGYIDLKPVSKKDPGVDELYSPIAVASAQYGRMHLPNQVWNSPSFDDNDDFGAELLEEVVQVFYENFKDGFKNPNQAIWDKDRAKDLVVGKSWIRLNNVNDFKLGGGCRVASIRMNDNWDDMTGITDSDFDYGQEYSYTENYLKNGIEYTRSSGVAAYEPQIGGDENPFRQPVFFGKENLMAPDDRFYQEEPFGESFFPSASVGYSKVVVKNLQRGVESNGTFGIQDDERNVIRHATGEVVHEFYTLKEYPTITKMTKMDFKRDNVSPFSILSILNFDTKDYFTASQGFVVELNDMHGKPKSQRVYQEDKDEPITEVQYFYQDEMYSVPKNGIKSPSPIVDNQSKKLTNEVAVVFQNGQVSNENVGIVFDAVADFRQSKNTTISPSANGNVDVFIIPFLPPLSIPIFTVWPSYQQQRTRFRSAGFTKVIQRFGVLEKTVAKDLGSVVETKNLAYDAETGEVLVTETTTDFNDKIYTMNYPAYWHYDNMGPAYKNIGYTTVLGINAGVAITNTSYFAEGDELILKNSSGIMQKAWVSNVSNSTIALENFNGLPPSNGTYTIEITRSGRRNQQMQHMASITTLSNPLNAFANNLYENVVQASAIEFSDEWRTYCECLEDNNGNPITTNSYVLGTKGNYRPIISYLPLSDRTQGDYNNNTNIREDGMFERYRPYYYLNNGKWKVDRQDWTYTASVTEFNPYGQELENQDALGRFSAATFGFNQTLAKSVAANARFREIGFTSFEDDDFSECADNHFKFDQDNLIRDRLNSHTGAYSVKVSPGNDATLTREIAWCDPQGCDLTYSSNSSGNTVMFTPSGGTPDYILDWTLISGQAPQFQINPSTGSISVNKNRTFTMVIKWVDANGCSVSVKVISDPKSVTGELEIITLN